MTVPADVEAMCEQIYIKSSMIRLGERIALHSECDLMDEAAAMLRLLAQRIENILNIQFKTTAETVKQIQLEQAAWQQQLDSLSKERDQWHARAIALFWNGNVDDVTVGKIREATALIDTALAAKEQP